MWHRPKLNSTVGTLREYCAEYNDRVISLEELFDQISVCTGGLFNSIFLAKSEDP